MAHIFEEGILHGCIRAHPAAENPAKEKGKEGSSGNVKEPPEHEIRPGITKTDLTAPVKEKYDKLIAEGITPIQRWGTPEDMGRAVYAIATDCLPFSTGEVIHVDGGFHLRTL